MLDELEQPPPLSSIGLQRREAILQVAKRHASRRRARMVAARGVAGLGIALGLGSLLWMRWSNSVPRLDPPPIVISREPLPAPSVPVPSPAISSSPYAHFEFAVIETNDSLAGRYTIRETSAPSVIVLTDDQLLDSLQSAGIEAGIAQVGDRSLLMLEDPHRQSTP